jgi:hypothetical protein
MEKALLASASFEGKQEFKLPAGAVVISKNFNVTVKEIENGYILRKSYDIKWTKKDSDDTQYEYFSKEWYSKENPLQITLPEDKSLADKL